MRIAYGCLIKWPVLLNFHYKTCHLCAMSTWRRNFSYFRTFWPIFVLVFVGSFLHLYFQSNVKLAAAPREDDNESNSHPNRLQHNTKLKFDPNSSVSATSVSPVSWQVLWHKTIDKTSSCKQTHEESRFREIERGTLVYSAWFDDRKTQSFIRVLLLTSTRDPLPSLFCHFETNCAPKQNVVYTSRVSFYQNSGNHFMKFGSFIASCRFPPGLHCKPCFVNISTRSISKTQNKNIDTVVLPVGFMDQHNAEKVSRGQYGICIPPLRGEISVDRLIEFLELSQILGASYFTFYSFAVSKGAREVLNYYKDKGLARVLSWNLPSYIGKYDIHYFGQILSIMDCLFRSMSRLHFVAFNDLDEFIVPLRNKNVITFLEKIHKGEYCGHCFDSVTFDPSRENLPTSRLLMTQQVFRRTKKPTPFWSKCIVDPRKIFEQGIHHIVMPIEDNYITNKVDWNIARVFHYRKCHDTQALMHCSAFEEDKTMQKFGVQLKRNFRINRLLSGIAHRNRSLNN